MISESGPPSSLVLLCVAGNHRTDRNAVSNRGKQVLWKTTEHGQAGMVLPDAIAFAFVAADIRTGKTISNSA
jgi:hypothetical protein